MERKYYTTSGSWEFIRNSQKYAFDTEEQLKEKLLAIKELAHCVQALSESMVSGDPTGVAGLSIFHLAEKIEQEVDTCHIYISQINSHEKNQINDWLLSFVKKSKKTD
ncbi:MAG: hypothetical protein EBU46_11120, partial [Nitrosomonadaceae bacterium]|nr:hypothetical protein [Nitrosomonadaceae bacterium]